MYNDFAKFVGKNFLREVFASEKEITDNFEASYYNDLNKKDNNIKTFNKGGIPLYYKDNNVYAQSKEDHTLIFGASGSGKTRALIFPLIYNLANNNENMVISDIKGEIHETMSGYLKDKGYNVLVFNLKDPTHSLKFSFLHTPYHLIRDNPNDEESVAKGEELLTDLSHTLLAGSRNNNSEGSKDPYWDNAAQRTVLAALLILIYNADSEDECNFYNLALIIDALAGERDDENSSDLLDKYYDNLPRNSSIKSNLGVVITNAKGSQTRQCIISCARNLIDIFTSNPLIASILNQTEINFNDFNGENKKTALFVIVPDDKTSYNSIFAMMVTQLYQTLLYELVKAKKQKLTNRLNFVLDEFANIPNIKHIDSMLTASRSRNIRFFLVLQSNAQLVQKYREAGAKILKSNCQNWIFLNSKEEEVLNEIVNKVGPDSIDPKTMAISITDLALLKKDFPYFKALVFTQYTLPFLTTLYDISKYSDVFDQSTQKLIHPPVILNTVLSSNSCVFVDAKELIARSMPIELVRGLY